MDRRTRLSSSKKWQLVHEDQDIRGWDALDFAGRPMGTVNDLIINTRTKLVEIVELTDGREYHAQKVEIGDGVIYIDTTGGSTASWRRGWTPAISCRTC
jgi:hypothetical protein